MGDTIMVRSLAPLPRLEEITFLRPDTRAFVTGHSVYPLTVPVWFPYFLAVCALIFAVFGLYVTLAGLFPMQVVGHALASDDLRRIPNPILFLLALTSIGFCVYFRKLIRGDQKLAVDGGLIPAELVSAKVRATKSGNFLRAACRFTSPEGKVVTATKSVGRPNRRLTTAPPAGAKILVLYDSDRLWQML